MICQLLSSVVVFSSTYALNSSFGVHWSLLPNSFIAYALYGDATR
jgi:hypothetical protein